MMTNEKAMTITEAAKRLGISRKMAYHLAAKHDPATGTTVLERYTPPGVVGWETQQTLLVTAESVERYNEA
jgi:molybdenum-dependent DNA-binding transcriptional regulator ModE